MNKRMFWTKVVMTVIIVGAALFYLYPTYKLNRMAETEIEELKTKEPEKYNSLKDRVINLGLDLQGGLHLVLEVDDTNLSEDEKKDAPERAMEVIRNRVDQFGVAEPSITMGEDKRIIVQLPGVKNKDRAIRLLQGTAQLTFQLLMPPDKSETMVDFFNEVDKILAAEGYKSKDTESALSEKSEGQDVFDENKEELELDSTPAESDSASMENESLADSSQQSPEDTPDEIDEEKENEEGEKPLTSRLLAIGGGEIGGGEIGVLADDYDWAREVIDREEIKKFAPAGNSIYWGKEKSFDSGMYTGKSYRSLYFVQDKIELKGDGVTDALVQFNDSDPTTGGAPYVMLKLSRQAQNIFANVTGEHVGERLAIILDNIVQSAPNIQERINSSSARITGNFSLDEASDLVIVLRAGALPAPLEIMEERSVGPSLGHDSIQAGVMAMTLGGLLVIIFMMVWYRASGVVAVVALTLNIILLFAALAMMNATLTLPGIAGIILTIGMAVDANVLIFERIREEIRNRKTIRAAIDAGYARAFLTILDANVTTLITAVVLFQFGTGPVKGFAVTLMYGIIISMFTAIVISRLFFDFATMRWDIKKLSI
ncbi:MAG: protein translocase subunit SecD [Candidatus Cloacimonetes bacterium 4572_55]|nr:MAG: protein translocase subunit SecD [Candidatus Cloacimonetes bacterium 4572_55]